MSAAYPNAKAGKPHDVHVIADPERSRWKVEQGGRTVSNHRTQSNAVKAARRKAKRTRVDLVTHGRDGKIRSKDSYGNESPTRDSEH
jgi:hypothetical protein